MRMVRVKKLQAVAASLLLSATLFGVAGCAAPQQEGSPSGDAETQESAVTQDGVPTKDDYDTLLQGKNLVSTFIGEKFYDQKVQSEDDALAAVKSAYDRIGADETTDLELTTITTTQTGETYYSYNQMAGDVFVYGACAKLIVNKDGEAVGLVSSILPNTQVKPIEDWEVSSEKAEEIVVAQCAETGHEGVEIVKDATEQTIIPVPEVKGRQQYAWVVYTDNYDSDSEMSYLAHYVDANGSYLYGLPISEPHNADAEAGDIANFDFTKYQADTWKGEVTLHDGTPKEIEVPVLVDPATNEMIMGDAERKIVCADYAQWEFEDTLQPCVSEDRDFNNVDMIAYDTFIKVWDFYAGVGWKGPDGLGTPTLILTNLVDKNGDPYDNAFYHGRKNGFQIFAFNRLNPDGENMDIVAHEFTHCVTGTTMTTNLYENEMAAINEGMSDVMGNLIEMMLVKKPETAWIMGDSSGEKPLRNMRDPHEYLQPEYRWDMYYGPSVTTATGVNDQGGAHVNSSLLSIVSYKLDQAGMATDDQFYFWMNVANAMTPSTDYTQMAQLLPWCMEQAGYGQYVDTLKAAMDEAVFVATDAPDAPASGMGKVVCTYPGMELAEKGQVRLMMFAHTDAGAGSEISSWPAARTADIACFVPAGDYYVAMAVGADEVNDCEFFVYTGDGWKEIEELDFSDSSDGKALVSVGDGQAVELVTTGLPEQVEEAA